MRRNVPSVPLDPDISAAARVLADRSRAAMLQALLDETSLPALELARRAGVGPPTATVHLTRLARAGLVVAQRRDGRRFFTLREPGRVAEAFETLARLAPDAPRPVTDGARRIAAELRRARTCYDHLAGGLGVAVADTLVARGLLGDAGCDFRPTPRGRAWLARTASIDVDDLARRPRPISRACLDWSERRHHLAGALGKAVAEWFFTERWIVRAREGRAVRVTESGTRALRELLGLAPPPSPPADGRTR
jgi:DNA-binding transcriptional ArsR family regulator